MIAGAIGFWLIGTTPVQPLAIPPPKHEISADSQAEARLDLARRIVEATLPADQRDAMFANMLQSITGTMVNAAFSADPRLREIFEELPEVANLFAQFVEGQNNATIEDLSKSWPKMLDALAIVYARRFSLAELEEIDRFASTPTGRRFLQSGTSLFGEPEVVAWQTDFLTRSQTRSKGALQKFIDDLKPFLEAQDEQSTDS